MKNCTDIEQSKRLAEILPIKSADMWWSRCTITDFGDGVLKVSYAVEPCNISQFRNTKEDVPAWSLAALLSILPNNEHITTSVSRGSWQIEPINYLPNTWWCEYEDNESLTEFNVSADNPVDACYKMILRLHKHKML